MLQFFSLTIFTLYVVVYVGNLSITCLFGFAAWMKRWAVPGYCLDRGASERFKQQQNYQIFTLFFPNILHFSTEEFYSVKCVQKGAFSGQTYFSPSPSQNWDKNKLLYPSVGVLFCTREMEKLCFQKGIFLLCWFCCVANMNPEQCLLSCQICEKSLCGRTASICANS